MVSHSVAFLLVARFIHEYFLEKMFASSKAAAENEAQRGNTAKDEEGAEHEASKAGDPSKEEDGQLEIDKDEYDEGMEEVIIILMLVT